GEAALQALELLRLAALPQQILELVAVIEMIFDRGLAATGDENEFLDAGGARFLDRILDQRLVDQRQHLFWPRLGRGKEAGAKTADGKDRLAYALRHVFLASKPNVTPVPADHVPVACTRRPGRPKTRRLVETTMVNDLVSTRTQSTYPQTETG